MKNAKTLPRRICLGISLVAVILYAPGVVGLPLPRLFDSLERMWHHSTFPMRAGSLRTGDERLIVLAVDNKAVQTLGFPLPRKYYASALDELTKHGAKVVIFDVLFFEPREGDQELAAAMRRHGGVINLYNASITAESHGKPHIERAVPLIEKASKALGCPIVNNHIDTDGRVRTMSLFDSDIADPIRGDKYPVTSVAAAALALFTGRSLDDLQAAYPTDSWAFLMLNYRRPRVWPMELDPTGVPIYTSPYRYITILDLVRGKLTPEQKKALKGAIVIIGSTTTGYYDHYPTPFASQAPRAEYHINIIDNVLNDDALLAPSMILTVCLVFLVAWVPYLLLPFAPIVGAVIVTFLLAGMLAGSLALMNRGEIIYPVAPGVTLLASFLAVTIYRVLNEGAEKKAIKALFGQFVAPEVVNQLANDPSKVKLGGEKRELTIFFLDIAHFTNISEKMDPEQLIHFLNRYLTALSDPILESHGTIDKYIGDCIMAFWNAPVLDPDHRKDAVLTALACQRIILELNKTLDPGVPEVPMVRIGINSGVATVALTGTQRKIQYTAIGDEVNLASRLEGANKFFGSKIMISGSTYDGAKDVCEARYLGRARVVGKATPVPVYEPLAEKGKLTPEWAKALPVWEKGIKVFYDKKYEEALALFTEFMTLMPGDGPGELYLNISRDYAALPPDDWDQVFNLTAK